MRHLALALALIAVANGCSEMATQPGSTNQEGPSYAISDGAHGGNPLLYFLPPIAPRPAFSGEFDGSQQPTIAICSLSGSECHTQVATFPWGKTAASVRVDAVAEQYIANWKTTVRLTPQGLYRVRVFVGGAELGYADVRLAAKESKDAFKVGTTITIRFRLEKPSLSGKLSVALAAGVSGTPVAGSTTHVIGETLAYSYQALEGYSQLSVRIDGQSVATQGGLVVAGEHTILVTATRSPPVPAAAVPLLAQLRELNAAADPPAAMQAFVDDLQSTLRSVSSSEADAISTALLYATGASTDGAAILQFAQAAGNRLYTTPPQPTASARISKKTSRVLAAAAPEDRIPVAFIYVNGVAASQADASIGLADVSRVVKELYPEQSEGTEYFTEYYYNRSGKYDPNSTSACLLDGRGGTWLTDCLAERSSSWGQAYDFAEATQQVLQVLNLVDGTLVEDAQNLKALLQAQIDNKRAIVLVAHSQGNLMAAQATAALAPEDQRCIGIVSLGEPEAATSWPIYSMRSSTMVGGVHTKDIIARLGYIGGLTATTITEREDNLYLSVPALPLWLRIYRGLESGFALHSSHESYFGAPESRASISQTIQYTRTALEQRCGPSLVALPEQLQLNYDGSANVEAKVFDWEGNAIDPQPEIFWSTDDLSKVLITGSGNEVTVRGLSAGSTFIVATTESELADTVMVTVGPKISGTYHLVGGVSWSLSSGYGPMKPLPYETNWKPMYDPVAPPTSLMLQAATLTIDYPVSVRLIVQGTNTLTGAAYTDTVTGYIPFSTPEANCGNPTPSGTFCDAWTLSARYNNPWGPFDPIEIALRAAGYPFPGYVEESTTRGYYQ